MILSLAPRSYSDFCILTGVWCTYSTRKKYEQKVTEALPNLSAIWRPRNGNEREDTAARRAVRLEPQATYHFISPSRSASDVDKGVVCESFVSSSGSWALSSGLAACKIEPGTCDKLLVYFV